jgi:5-methyltetrahydrofolate--homocysteine methyltransferase
MSTEPSTPLLDALRDAVLNGNAKGAGALTAQALAAGVDPQAIVDTALIPAMDEAGRRFDQGEFFVPELLVAARALKASQALVTPLLAASGATPRGKVVIGTVKGDLHDIGKNLVVALLRGGGFEVIDLGADVAPGAFVAAVRDHAPHVVGLSALLTTTMMQMQQTIHALAEAGVRDRVKIIVGGAPVTERFAAQCGADGYADNAAAAVTLARALVADPTPSSSPSGMQVR